MISELVNELRHFDEREFYSPNYEKKLLERAADTIEMLSAKAREQEWVPCEERLPEEHEWIGTKRFGTTISDEVHITFDVNGERFVRTLSLQNGELSNYDKQTMDALYKDWKMVAWMPLPEPWEGVDDDSQIDSED